MTEQEQRSAVATEARTWVGTPYHRRAWIKGAGVDCAYIILESFVGAGLIERFDLGKYNFDWHLHRNEEKYLAIVGEHMELLESYPDGIGDPSSVPMEQGDVIVFKIGQTYSHGAIVVNWPRVVHASLPARIVEEVDITNTPMSTKPIKRYTFWRN